MSDSIGTGRISGKTAGDDWTAVIVQYKGAHWIDLIDGRCSRKCAIPGRIPLLIGQAAELVIGQQTRLRGRGGQRSVHISLDLRLRPGNIPYSHFIDVA